METRTHPWTLGQIAEWVRGELKGPGDLAISGPTPADGDDENGITFAESADYLAAAEQSPAAAVLVPRGTACGKPSIEVDSPRMAFGYLLARAVRPLPIEPGVHPQAYVHPEATVHPEACVAPFAVVERGAVIGAKARVYSFAYVGENCTVGAGAAINPHAVLVQDVTVGPGSTIHSGAVIGADGFGYYWDGKQRAKVPQIGGVQLGENVEIGANATVDRATAGDSRLGEGTKIDNLVQVGHNAKIGKHVVIAGMSGISGSVTIGDRAVIGGSVGIADHVAICDDVVLGARTGVAQDITEPGEYFGAPALPRREAIRAFLLYPKLPELYSRLKDLEKRVKELESED